MITIIPIEPLSEAHGMLIVEAFNRLFINGGGWPDNVGDGVGYGNGVGDGVGYGNGYGFGNPNGKCPEAWQAE